MQADALAANSVVAGKVAAGAIGVDQLAAKVITTEKLVVADFTNLIHDGELATASAWAVDPAGVFSIVNTTRAGMVGGKCFFTSGTRTAAAGSTYIGAVFATDLIPVEDAAQYHFACFVDVEPPCTGDLRLRVAWKDINGVDLAVGSFAEVGSANMANGATQKIEAILTAPAGARKVQVYVRRGATTAGGTVSGTVLAGGLSARRATTGAMVVQGSLTADRLNAASMGVAGVSVFGGQLASSNYASGSAGWRITHAGDAEFNTLVVRTGMLALNATAVDYSAAATGLLEVSSTLNEGTSLPLANGAETLSISVTDAAAANKPIWLTYSADLLLKRSTVGYATAVFDVFVDGVSAGFNLVEFYADAADRRIREPVTIFRRVAGVATVPFTISVSVSCSVVGGFGRVDAELRRRALFAAIRKDA